MKIKSTLFFLIISSWMYSQIGINTTTPTKELDVNGQLRVRDLPNQNVSNSSVLTADAEGNLGKTNLLTLVDVNSVTATAPVTRNINGNATINNIDLGLSTTVTIPANKETIVIINYSVPIGVPDFSRPQASYYGIRFLKNNVEAPAGSRKFAVGNTGELTIENVNMMISVSNLYTEVFPASPTERTVEYTLNGYIEQYSGNHTYRFNMFSTTPPNFNWGIATLSKQVYIR